MKSVLLIGLGNFGMMIQVKNLRDVSDALRPYVQADMDNMAKEIADKKKKLQKLDAIEKQRSDQYSDLSKTLEIAMNFEKMTKDEDPEVIVSIIRSIVERIIVTQEGKDSNVHLFLKGQPGENYDDFFADSDTLIDAESRSDELCDSEGCRKVPASSLRKNNPAQLSTSHRLTCDIRPL